MRFVEDMLNPTRLPAKIKVSPSKNHAKIDKNVLKIDPKKRRQKKESVCFIDFFQFVADFVSPLGAQKRKKPKQNF